LTQPLALEQPGGRTGALISISKDIDRAAKSKKPACIFSSKSFYFFGIVYYAATGSQYLPAASI
jgi:hypothetical protein